MFNKDVIPFVDKKALEQKRGNYYYTTSQKIDFEPILDGNGEDEYRNHTICLA